MVVAVTTTAVGVVAVTPVQTTPIASCYSYKNRTSKIIKTLLKLEFNGKNNKTATSPGHAATNRINQQEKRHTIHNIYKKFNKTITWFCILNF